MHLHELTAAESGEVGIVETAEWRFLMDEEERLWEGRRGPRHEWTSEIVEYDRTVREWNVIQLLLDYRDLKAIPDEKLTNGGVTRAEVRAWAEDANSDLGALMREDEFLPQPLPRLAIPVYHHPPARARAPRSRNIPRTRRAKARAPSGDPSEPEPPLDLVDIAVLVLGWGRV